MVSRHGDVALRATAVLVAVWFLGHAHGQEGEGVCRATQAVERFEAEEARGLLEVASAKIITCGG